MLHLRTHTAFRASGFDGLDSVAADRPPATGGTI